jgi:methylene-tetrahydromethanopterin dehydrogenase
VTPHIAAGAGPDDGAPVGTHGAKGLGALAIGNVKFKTQHKLFEDMRAAEKPLALDFRQAFEVAIALAGS